MTNENDLIERYLDDSLTDEQAIEFQTWLKASDENVKKFALASARNEQLRAIVAAEEEGVVATASGSRDSKPRGMLRPGTAARGMTAACLLIAGIWLFSSPAHSAPQVSLVGSNSPVSLRSGQEPQRWLNTGDSFTTGTLVTENDATRARFAYVDGTVFTLRGETELTLEDDPGKRLVLSKGLLLAEVLPQPRQQPMKVLTPTAEATVLGTTFALNAETNETLLQVRDGEVTLRRLIDDREATARNNEQLLALQTGDQPLQAEPITDVPASWKASSKRTPGQTWLGTWNDEGVLKAVPRKILLKKPGVEEEHFHAGIRSEIPGVVTLEKDSEIRIRYRTAKPINVGLFLSTRSATWDFTGNFQAYLVEEENPADADGWRTGTVPATSLLPMGAKIPFQPGCVVSTILATTYAQDAGLEVAEFEVISK